MVQTMENLSLHRHDNNKPYKRAVEYKEESTRNPKNTF